MPWNETTRREYARHGRRYASGLTGWERALVGSFLPARKKIGRPRTTELRDVLDAKARSMISDSRIMLYLIDLPKFPSRKMNSFSLKLLYLLYRLDR